MEGRTAALVANPEYAPTVAVPELDGRIDALKRQIDESLRNYTEQHPDIISSRRLLAQLEEDRKREIAARRKAAIARPSALPSGDPVVEQLKAALNEAEGNVTTVRAKVAEFEARYIQYKAAAESLPRIDSEFTQLNRDYDIQKSQYASLVSRRETASMTGKLEDAGVAEFRIIDPPRVTPNPVAPNRMALLWGLIAGSLAAGFASALAVSLIRPTFHDGRVLREIAGRPLLGMISMIAGPELRSKRRRSALIFVGGMSGLMASYAVAFTITYLAAGKL
jgi:polysaccharide chain length determinant protein (PEP-CTERM system associated)